ncbi:hypothetical protein K4L44_06635 [Halosquirtibacter laminarini]|uniref:Uncharacterized protein n=1 Tax=Halosquirtibacter laminarini TaxID=3374600 RepID=A0AC61NIY8_9BACT|nr:hypothetical protein K4L44_06635 [Prolixibacteraceae bacterium]
MKGYGIFFVVIGTLAFLGDMSTLIITGRPPNFVGVCIVILGAFLCSTANRHKREMEKEKKDRDAFNQ